MKRWPGIFRTSCKASIRRNLAYSKSWNIQNPSIIAFQIIFRTLSYLRKFSNIQNPVIFTKTYEYPRTLTYLKPYTIQNPLKDLRFEFFAKIVRNYNYYSKALYLRSLTGFWIRLFLNKYPLTCRVTWRYVYHDTYSEPWLLL